MTQYLLGVVRYGLILFGIGVWIEVTSAIISRSRQMRLPLSQNETKRTVNAA